MKKIILISALLLFSSNGWTEEIYLSCDCIAKTSNVSGDGLDEYYSGECQSVDTKKIAVVLDKSKKYLSLPIDSINPNPPEKYIENDIFYTRLQRCTGGSFCETWRVLNRVTLVLEDFNNWDENTKGSINPTRSNHFIKKKYQCSISDRL